MLPEKNVVFWRALPKNLASHNHKSNPHFSVLLHFPPKPFHSFTHPLIPLRLNPTADSQTSFTVASTSQHLFVSLLPLAPTVAQFSIFVHTDPLAIEGRFRHTSNCCRFGNLSTPSSFFPLFIVRLYEDSPGHCRLNPIPAPSYFFTRFLLGTS